jgi:hypothetical protein
VVVAKGRGGGEPVRQRTTQSCKVHETRSGVRSVEVTLRSPAAAFACATADDAAVVVSESRVQTVAVDTETIVGTVAGPA